MLSPYALTATNAQAWTLYYGSARTPLAHVVPDSQWPNMWRIQRLDGSLSDLANFSRACDAAAAICERGPPRRNPRLLHWKLDGRETARKAPCARPFDGRASS